MMDSMADVWASPMAWPNSCTATANKSMPWESAGNQKRTEGFKATVSLVVIEIVKMVETECQLWFGYYGLAHTYCIFQLKLLSLLKAE